MTARPRIALLHKPWGCLTQFTDGDGRATLADHFPHLGYYPAGRLDRDSEGLVVLTCDGTLQQRISNPRHKLAKVYRVQVEGQSGRAAPPDEALQALRNGVLLRDGPTLPADIRVLENFDIAPRDPPIRERREIPTHWLEIVIREGRNRQIRRMTASVGLPTLRLIRVAVGPWALGTLPSGGWRWADDDATANEFAEANIRSKQAQRPKRPRTSGGRRRKPPRESGRPSQT